MRRALDRGTIVIVDGMNYIKGWRYQLWCEAKAAGTTCCVVHVGAPEGVCVRNNENRVQTAQGTRNEEEEDDDPGQAYPPDLLRNLIFRYEEPSTSARWDRPLFTVPFEDEKPPADEIWEALTGIKVARPADKTLSLGEGLKPSSENNTSTSTSTLDTASVAPSTTTTTAVRRTRPKIIPHQATMAPQTTDPNTLYALEKRTSEVISAIRSYTLANPTTPTSLDTTTGTGNGAGLTIPITGVETPLFVPLAALASAPTGELAGAGGVLALPKMQRLRRQWVGLNRAVVGQGQGMGSRDPAQVAEAFVRFLNAEFEGVDADI